MNITNNNKFIILPVTHAEHIEVWNVASKGLAYKIDVATKDDNQFALITSPDSRFLFYTSELNEITQWDIKKKKVVAKFKGSHTSPISAISVSNDGKTMVSAGFSGHFCIHEIPEIKVLKR